MNFSFPRYLLSKQSVDDRALNRHVLEQLKRQLPAGPINIIEIGAGIGTMLRRLLRWQILVGGEYVMVEEMGENIEAAADWIPKWASEAGLSVQPEGPAHWRLLGGAHDLQVRMEHADVFDFIKRHRTAADLLIAHAVLDLFPMPASMPQLLSLTGNLAWLTMNFDGLTSLEPLIDEELDARIERL